MDYYGQISEKVEDLDIGLLVVNAGVAYDGRFEHTDPSKLQKMIDVNSYQVGALINHFLERFQSRGGFSKCLNRSGIIVVSSNASWSP